VDVVNNVVTLRGKPFDTAEAKAEAEKVAKENRWR
jgi:hypothetical protein